MIRLGIIGLSDGNGHPYSWSAIFNGYDPEAMAKCPFPIIPRYLSEHVFPRDALPGATVTHIWTQSLKISTEIAKAALIDNVVDDYRQMIGHVDALLLARDDAENHLAMSKPFLEAGLPVYIDKPIALSLQELETIFSYSRYPGQIFSCSALRYAQELRASVEDGEYLGEIRHIHATAPKGWDTYAVHVIEPVLSALGFYNAIDRVHCLQTQDKKIVDVIWCDGPSATFSVLGKAACPLSMAVYGTHGHKVYEFKDSFAAFKAALADFLRGVLRREISIPYDHMKAVVEIIEKGRQGG